MKKIQAFKFRICPTPEQEVPLFRHAGGVRFVWNKALDLQKRRLDAGIPILSYGDLAKLLTLWRSSEEYGFLSLGPVHPQQQTLRDLDRALWEALSGKRGFPRFKRKGEGNALRYPDPLQIKLDLGTKDEDGRNLLPRIFLPKVGWVKVRLSRTIEGELRNVTVTEKAGRWSVSVQTEREITDPIRMSGPEVGLDLGIASFATLSDGTRVHPDGKIPEALKRAEDRLRWEQRKLARKWRKGPKSRNYRKQKRRVARAHASIADMRLDFLHKVSTAISKTQAVVYVEDLRIRNMTRSARGTKDVPGKNVRPKAGLNRSILSQGWGEFKRQLDYKLGSNGGTLVVVPPAYTSQTCSACGHVSAENRKSQAAFQCIACGFEANADHNAAINILRVGQTRCACSPESSGESAA